MSSCGNAQGAKARSDGQAYLLGRPAQPPRTPRPPPDSFSCLSCISWSFKLPAGHAARNETLRVSGEPDYTAWFHENGPRRHRFVRLNRIETVDHKTVATIFKKIEPRAAFLELRSGIYR